ncbi:hypothetical protein SCATT_p09260 (plasmid) [Streptantibioticus cattleyicolor NRRL 8057 = DSM 46488]|uniref:HTH cro/C1-type domain-containing protein n=1 Tax=Streptantibioticus cattleyicolor (strain ATCC 35852 / DSM 46488 / JCM 4925 / NBRC 14057 / NRRL 8057) TaxID=1003195 RepID=F8JNC1_STREN|nr:hypothetical protein SCATT_p09260 [Streptantibioticus cattleyicolor NRRL 8057 = DSM 46488]CCB71838.1 conserved protein of unknown function [Streptantibioticus cattleyicolor NRRL 8057 = DSM 46488]
MPRAERQPENFTRSLPSAWCGAWQDRYVRLMEGNAILRRRMKKLGLTQDELADQMNSALADIAGRPGDFTARTIHNLMSGRTKRPIGRTRVALEKVFGCPVEDLGFRPHRNEEDSMRRRNFIARAAGTAVTAAGVAAPKRIGHADVARLEAKFAAIVADDHQYGGRVSIETRASALAGEALSLLQRGSASQKVRERLYACAASFTSSALWAAIDGRRFNDAQRYLDRVANLASMSGDSAIQFRIWSHAGTLYRHLGRPVDALTANDVARRLAITRRDPLFASLGLARQAAIHGLAGDAIAVQRSIDKARQAFSRAQPDADRPAWMTAFFDQAEIESLALTAHLSLGNFAQAEAHAHRGIALLRPHMRRSRAIATARLAHAQLGQGDLGPALATAMTVANGETSSHPRIASMLDEFGAKMRLAAPHSKTASCGSSTCATLERTTPDEDGGYRDPALPRRGAGLGHAHRHLRRGPGRSTARPALLRRAFRGASRPSRLRARMGSRRRL